MTDQELKELNLPEVPDDLLDRWLELLSSEETLSDECKTGKVS